MDEAVPARPLTYPQVLSLCPAAHHAPSAPAGHPWLFRPLADGLDVIERGHHSPTPSSQDERTRLIACGAAVRNAEVALAHLGYAPVLRLLPDGPEAARLATLTAGAPVPISAAKERTYRAIWTRRTYRRVYMVQSPAETPLPAGVFGITEAAGVRLAVVPPARRPELADLLWRS